MPFVNDGFAKQDPAGGGGGGSTTNASDLTSGTLADARLSAGILNATYQHNQYVLTTGTGTAYVAAPTAAVALAAGAEILCGIHATSGLNPTLNVSGTGAKSILKETSAGLAAVTAGQLVSGPNIYKFTYNAGFDAWVVSSPTFITADDIPSGINATKIGDGSVTSTEFGYLDATSSIQTQLNGKASTSHTHALDDISDVTLTTPTATQFLKFTGTGNASANGSIAAGDLPTGIDAAKLHDGTIGNSDLVCIKDLATTGGAGHVLKQETVGGPVTSGPVSATDSTKLALDGSNDMAANISFSAETAATGGATREIGFNAAGGFINAPTGDIALQAMVNNVSLLDVSTSGVVANSQNIIISGSTPVPGASDNCLTTYSGAGFGLRCPTAGSITLYVGGNGHFVINNTNIRIYIPIVTDGAISFNGAQTSAGNSAANIFRDSTGDLNYNVDTGDVHDFTINGTRALAIGSTGLITPITTVTTTATISTPYTRCNHASTPFTVTLPAATGSGAIFMIKNVGAATVTVDGNASETIDGATTITLAQYSAVTLVDAASGAWDII